MKNKFFLAAASALALAFILPGAACSSGEYTTVVKPEVGKPVTLPVGLQYTIISPGTGAPARPGHLVKVNYTGRLINGTVFDSSIGRQPFVFTLGAGQVIMGWDIGVTGMKVGEKRQLRIPPDLGYGSSATGKIPPNSTLIFEVELLEVN